MKFPHVCDYIYWKTCSIATKYRRFGETAILTLTLGYVLIRALTQALQTPTLSVLFQVAQ